MVILALRTLHREEFDASAAMMLYGMNLRLPNQFYPTSTAWSGNPRGALLRHQQNVASCQYIPTCFPTNQKVHMNHRLLTCSHVMLSNEHKRHSLNAPWTGPLKVFLRGPKTYTIDWKGKAYTVSVDRLQPAYVLTDFVVQPTRCTPHVMFLVLYETIIVLLLHHTSVASLLQWIRDLQLLLPLVRRKMRPTTPRLPHRRPLPAEFTRIHGHAPFADLHSSVHNNQRFLFSVHFCLFCVSFNVISQSAVFSLPTPQIHSQGNTQDTS